MLIDDISLNPSQTKKWTIVANVNQTIDSIIEIKEALKDTDAIEKSIELSVQEGRIWNYKIEKEDFIILKRQTLKSFSKNLKY